MLLSFSYNLFMPLTLAKTQWG